MRWQRIGLILVAVLVLVLVGGPYYGVYLDIRVITQIGFTALLIAWLGGRIRAGRYLPVTPLNWPLYAAALVIAFSCLFSLDPRIAAEHAWWPLVHALIFFFCASMIEGGRQRLLFEILFLTASLTVLLASLDFVIWATQIGEAVDLGAVLRGQAEFPPVTPMLTLPLHASTALAGYVTPQIVIAFGWAATAQRRTDRLVLAGLGFGLGAVLLGTGSRGGILALGSGIIVFLLLRLAPQTFRALRSDRKEWLPLLAGGAATLVVAVAAIGLVLYIGRSAARSSGDAIRASLWSSAAAAVQDYPVFGLGTGEFGRAARLYRQEDDPVDYRHRQAHNIVLNTAAEEGIAGVVVLGSMAATLLWGWFHQRRSATGVRAIRLDIVLAALAAVAVHAQFDVFFTTPFVALVALLAAFSSVPPVARPARRAEQIAAWAALALVIGFGIFWIPADVAQAHFQRSVRERDAAALDEAAALDPGLRLYDLQRAYLTGLAAQSDLAVLPSAIAQFEAALAAEPTWETGWILLAGLHEQAGRMDEALAALERAQAINRESAASWNWARIADAHNAAPDDAIVTAYARAMSLTFTRFSPAWVATPRRLQAVEAVYASAGPRLRYQLAEAFFPERRADLVPANPTTADEWWVAGQYALTIVGDPAAAFAAFSEAIRLNPNREIGDYYAARARAGAALGPDAWAQARRDAAMAELLVTFQERPAATLALIAEAEGVPSAELRRLRAAATPNLVVDQNFEGVLFGGRVADFRLPPALQPPGPGPAAFAPAYAIAADDETAGDLDSAANVYRYILDAAPDEARAAARLAELAAAAGS